jgi:UDP-N-acetylmuramoyl-tripeptide--D-alanyl-D-alanine ligase
MLSEVAHILGAQFSGQDSKFTSINTDSRVLQVGELFIAIKGEHFNGHEFINQAKALGAVAAIVSEKVVTDLPTLLVSDTRLALGNLAAHLRSQKPIPLFAITGSCGKTTTKTMLASILSQRGSILANQGTFNNDIGVPVTLLQQKPEHEYAVIEMGANHFGEIAYLTNIARPNVASVINVGAVHLEGFGDLTGVSRAKGEIFQGLVPDGVAIINIDETYAEYFFSLVGNRRIITFGFKPTADIWGEAITLDEKGRPSFLLHVRGENCTVKLPTVGIHNVSNALAAAAMAYVAETDIETIKQGLEDMQPVAKRMIWRQGHNGIQIIDDSYNANPNATLAALEVLAKMPGEKIFVFGGMAELGQHAEQEHVRVGQLAREIGIQQLYATGAYSDLTVSSFGQGGCFFDNKMELIVAVRKQLRPAMTLLIKGSRSSRMEEVVMALTITEGK